MKKIISIVAVLVLILLGVKFFGGKSVVNVETDNKKNDKEAVVNEGGTNSEGGETIDEVEVIDEMPLVVEDLKDSGVFLTKDLAGYTPAQYEEDKYEVDAKRKEAYIALDFKDENDVTQIGVVNTLNVTDEDILYALSTYTDYAENGNDVNNLTYTFKVLKDFEGRYKDIDEGTILVSADNIFVLMAESPAVLESLLNVFNKSNPTTGTFDDFLQKNNALVNDMKETLSTQSKAIQAYNQKVPQSVKSIGLKMWDAYITLNEAELTTYYADTVWFYADPDEWFSEQQDTAGYTEKQFYSVDRAKLLESYKEIKSEEFKEELSLMKALKEKITFYYIDDLMQLCDGEDKATFYSDLNAQSQDVVMFAQRGAGNNNICTLNGKFNFKEKNFWILRNINGKVQVVTDFNE